MGKRRMVWSLEGTVYLRFDREAKLREWKVYSPSSSGRPILVEEETAFVPILEPIPEAKPVPLHWRKDRLGKLVMVIMKRNNPHVCIMIGPPFPPGMYTCENGRATYIGVLQAILDETIELTPPAWADKTFPSDGSDLSYCTRVGLFKERIERILY